MKIRTKLLSVLFPILLSFFIGCSLVVDENSDDFIESTDSIADSEEATDSTVTTETDSEGNDSDSDTGVMGTDEDTENETDSDVDTATEEDSETEIETETDPSITVDCDDSICISKPSGCRDYEIAACKSGSWSCVNPVDCTLYSCDTINGKCTSNTQDCPKFYEDPPVGAKLRCLELSDRCCIPTNICVTTFDGNCISETNKCLGISVDGLPSCSGVEPRCCIPKNKKM